MSESFPKVSRHYDRAGVLARREAAQVALIDIANGRDPINPQPYTSLVMKHNVEIKGEATIENCSEQVGAAEVDFNGAWGHQYAPQAKTA